MDAVLKWIGIVGAVWLAVSILAAVLWAAGGRRIFRKPPVQTITIVARDDASLVLKDIARKMRRRNMQGGA